MSTSPAPEKALREAMARLIAGKQQTTDGKLTKENLDREAGISRATMNRAAEIMAEWDAYVETYRPPHPGREPAGRRDRRTDPQAQGEDGRVHRAEPPPGRRRHGDRRPPPR
ncbi:hypothetical protein OIU91_04770 [Streptomyces sp. NBC_01456]